MTESDPSFASAVLSVDLGAIAANWRLLAARHGRGATAAVVKADAYGLGAKPVASCLYAAGCRHFFTAHFAEALALRPLLPQAMLAALNGPPPGSEALHLAQNILPVLGSLAEIDSWTALARQRGQRLAVLLHVDTGMNRLGLDSQAVATLAAQPERLHGLEIRYLLTHLLAAEEPHNPANEAQRARFAAACAVLPPAPTSIANSSGLFLGPRFASDLARPGVALYGVNPTPYAPNPMAPVVRLRARLLAVRDIAAGEGVGYNATWRAERPSRIGTLGIGYADGWRRGFSGEQLAAMPVGKGFDARPVPLVGRVSMDLTTCDLTLHPGLGPGDWLELMGPDCPPERLAQAAGTNAYEILTGIAPRVRREYVE